MRRGTMAGCRGQPPTFLHFVAPLSIKSSRRKCVLDGRSSPMGRVSLVFGPRRAAFIRTLSTHTPQAFHVLQASTVKRGWKFLTRLPSGHDGWWEGCLICVTLLGLRRGKLTIHDDDCTIGSHVVARPAEERGVCPNYNARRSPTHKQHD